MMRSLSRRELIGLTAACVTAAVSGCRRAASSGACAPLAGRRIRWIVPNAPGGGYDTESRLLQPILEARLGAEILIVNTPGAGGRLGARAIADARPDGLTLGIAGMPGLLVASLLREPGAFDPGRAFRILGRVSRSAHVWAAAAGSPLRSVEDVMRAGTERPLLFAINEVGSANVVTITVAAALLGITVTLVPGFEGMRSATLAAMRGDVDLVSFNYETIRPLVTSGEVRPLLQTSRDPISDDVQLSSVPLLGGPQGLAIAQARDAGGDPQHALQLAAALDRTIGSGRVIVAPAALDATIADCLSRAVHATLISAELRDRGGRGLDVADAATAQADAAAAADDAVLLRPILESALMKLRS